MPFDQAKMLNLFDSEMRVAVPDPLPDGIVVDWDGPVRRMREADGTAWLEYVSLDGLSDGDLDALIRRLADACTGRLEWKHYGHDLPADLPGRLVAAGFVPEDEETVLIAEIADAIGNVNAPDGVAIRQVRGREDLEGIDRMHAAVWGPGRPQANSLEAEMVAAPEAIAVFVAEADGEIVSAGWVRMWRDVHFATLWGGSTLPAWRGRGIYRALVTARARLAAVRGYSYLQVDASGESRPILEQMGFTPITTTTPFVLER